MSPATPAPFNILLATAWSHTCTLYSIACNQRMRQAAQLERDLASRLNQAVNCFLLDPPPRRLWASEAAWLPCSAPLRQGTPESCWKGPRTSRGALAGWKPAGGAPTRLLPVTRCGGGSRQSAHQRRRRPRPRMSNADAKRKRRVEGVLTDARHRGQIPGLARHLELFTPHCQPRPRSRPIQAMVLVRPTGHDHWSLAMRA